MALKTKCFALSALAAGLTTMQAQIPNSQLLEALHAYRQNPAALHRLQATAAQRAAAITTLIGADPAAVLAAAIPDDTREAFPPTIRGLIEQHVKVRGQVDASIEDGPGYSRMHYGLLVEGRRVSLHFADEPRGGLQSGTVVQVEGVQMGDRMALSSSGLSVIGGSMTASILPNSFGAQKTLVILVNFQDMATQPYSPSTAYSVTFTSASNFYLNNSFQQTWLTGDVAGWYTIPVSSATCDTNSIQNYGLQAAQNAGYVPSNYSHIVYAFPQIGACSFWGLSNIGGNPSNSWVNGPYQLMVVAHELGHGFGLYHSHSLSCSGAVYASSGCTMSEYGDTFDAMGSTYPDDFSSAQKERLGWLNYGAQPPIATVSTSGTYSLGSYETADSLAKSLKIAGPNGTYYYVESRQAMGNDSSSLSSNTNVLTGVLLHNSMPDNPNSSYLLNATPGGSFTSPALDVGKSYTDSSMGFTITPLSVGRTGASVQVSYGAVSCMHANPSLTITGPSSSVAPGVTANFTITVTNHDSAACNTSTFAMGDVVPTGWTGVYNASQISLAPGASTPVILWVTAPSGTSNGTFTATATTSNTSATAYTASGSATEMVYTAAAVPVSLTVSSSQAIYTAPQKISISAALNGTAPVSGVGVTVNIVKSDGSAVTLTGTTGSNGVAVVGYQAKKNDPKGVWQSIASSGSSSASTSFTVR